MTEGGLAWCWGAGDQGQLGGGEGESRGLPDAVVHDRPFTSVSAGLQHTCGIVEDGRAFCWGWNGDRQLGEGSTLPHFFPFETLAGQRYSLLSAGWFHTCGVTLAGDIYCWGRNGQGQLGNGVREDRSDPVRAQGAGWTRVSAGARHTCALDETGGAWCWGANDVGQLGTGGTTSSAVPVRVAGSLRFRAIGAGFGHTCAVEVNGTAWCWGESLYGELGGTALTAGSPGIITSAVPAQVFGPARYADISAGAHVTCAVGQDSAVECWGRGLDGQLGDPQLSNRATPIRVRPLDTARFATVSVSPAGHVCALALAGGAYCWGRGPRGQLGIGNLTFTLTPARVVPQAR